MVKHDHASFRTSTIPHPTCPTCHRHWSIVQREKPVVVRMAKHLRFGVYGFRALEDKWMDKRQIEALRLLLQRKLREATGKRAELWVHVEPNVPVTKRTEKRMGGGKSPIKGWKGRVQQGQILFEWAASVNIPLQDIQSKCSVRLRSVEDPVHKHQSLLQNLSL